MSVALLLAFGTPALSAASAGEPRTAITVQAGAPGKAISPDLVGAKNLVPTAVRTVLAASDADTTDAQAVQPRTSTIPISPSFDTEAPANSLTVIRIHTR